MILMQADCDEMRETLIILVIENENLDRMKLADPITLEPTSAGGFLPRTKYPDVRMLVAYEPEPGPLYEMAQRNDAGAMLKHLMRGYRFGGKDRLRSHGVPKENA